MEDYTFEQMWLDLKNGYQIYYTYVNNRYLLFKTADNCYTQKLITNDKKNPQPRMLMLTLKRVKEMDKKAMLEKVNSIHEKTGRSRINIIMDMQKCASKYGAGYMDYDLFEMYNLTDEQRDTYLTRGRNNDLVTKYCDLNYLHY